MNKLIISIVSSFLIFSCSSGDKTASPIKNLFGEFNGNPVIPREANRLRIKPFLNRTAKPGIESRLAVLLKKHISLDGRLAVVSEKENPDILLRGSIDSYSVQSTSYSRDGSILQKRIIIKCSIILTDLKNKRVIFKDPFIQAFRKFSDRVPPVSTESASREYVLDNLAQRISSKTISGWYTEHLTPIEKGKKDWQ